MLLLIHALVSEKILVKRVLATVSISQKSHSKISRKKVSKPRELYLELFDRSEIRQAPRQLFSGSTTVETPVKLKSDTIIQKY